jgi:hypothetical protein
MDNFLVEVPFEFVDARIDKIICIAHGNFFNCVQLQKKYFFKGNVSCVGAELGSQILHL